MTVVPLEVPPDVAAVLDAQWVTIGQVGTWLTGMERVEVAALARSDTPPNAAIAATQLLGDRSATAAWLVGHRASSLTGEVVDGFQRAGLPRERYVEIVSVASRAVAIDTFDRGVAHPTRPLPRPQEGVPSQTRVEDAKRRSGWVATVGATSASTALTSVAEEAEAKHELHGALYLTLEQMRDLGIVRELGRSQMELVAARVSYLNDCEY